MGSTVPKKKWISTLEAGHPNIHRQCMSTKTQAESWGRLFCLGGSQSLAITMINGQDLLLPTNRQIDIQMAWSAITPTLTAKCHTCPPHHMLFAEITRQIKIENKVGSWDWFWQAALKPIHTRPSIKAIDTCDITFSMLPFSTKSWKNLPISGPGIGFTVVKTSINWGLGNVVLPAVPQFMSFSCHLDEPLFESALRIQYQLKIQSATGRIEEFIYKDMYGYIRFPAYCWLHPAFLSHATPSSTLKAGRC